MKGQFTDESLDKFTNTKIISTIRQKKFGGWLEIFEPNQSLELFKNDMAMPSAMIKFEVRLYATIVHSVSPAKEEIYIEVLNYFKDSYADRNDNSQNFQNASLDLVIDNENISIKSVMINDGVDYFERSGLANKMIFTRTQLIKFPLSKEQFTKFCDGKNVFMRISGIQNSVRVSNAKENIHEFKSQAVFSLQKICRQLYDESIQEGKYTSFHVPRDTKDVGKKSSPQLIDKKKVSVAAIILLIFLVLIVGGVIGGIIGLVSGYIVNYFK